MRWEKRERETGDKRGGREGESRRGGEYGGGRKKEGEG